MAILMTYGADALVIFASLGAMFYCMILSRRLSRLTSFDKGLGSAIAVMSTQVDEMKSALNEAKAGSDGAGQQLHDLVHQAREISSELEMMIAACHDFAEEAITVQDPTDPEDATIADVDELGSVPDPAGDALVGGEADFEAEDAPVFGSRRTSLRDAVMEDETVQPLFRHRSKKAV